jgi:hypothetical protein
MKLNVEMLVLAGLCLAAVGIAVVGLPDAMNRETEIHRADALKGCIKHGDYQSQIPYCAALEKHLRRAE